MRKLTNEDVLLNNVNTVSQYKVLEYLKESLDIQFFDVYLYNKDTIKVVDKNNDVGYFKYDQNKKEIVFIDGKKYKTKNEMSM